MQGQMRLEGQVLAWRKMEGSRVIRAPGGAHKRGAPPPRLAWVCA